MSTRALIILQDGTDEIAVVYHHSDGYPTGLGQDILDCLGGKTTTNGWSSGNDVAGAGCMCVQLIAYLKGQNCAGTSFSKARRLNSPGGVYLHPVGTRDMGEEYTYTLSCTEGEPITLTVDDGNELYSGPLDSFDPKACEQADED